MSKLNKFFTLFIVATFLFTASMVADEVKIKSNPHCGECKTKIESGLNKMSGVESAVVDVDSKLVTVNYDAEKTNPSAMMKEIKNMGFTASLNDSHCKTTKSKKSGSCCKSKKSGKSNMDCNDTKHGKKCDTK